MLTIRLTRKGKKNQPFFKVVVVDKRRSSKGGRSIEEVGFVNPLTKQKSLKKERILHWIKNGAQPSATVHNLLVTEKIIDAKKKHVARVKKAAEAAVAASAVPAPATAPTEEAKPAENPALVQPLDTPS